MSACAVRTKEIGGLALLGERYRRFGRSACCGGDLSSKGRGGVKCKARALGTIADCPVETPQPGCAGHRPEGSQGEPDH